jgi:hypothetical protein
VAEDFLATYHPDLDLPIPIEEIIEIDLELDIVPMPGLMSDLVTPLYCRYNSGSPRCSKGVGSARGPKTFVKSADADYAPCKVVEVTCQNQVTLPPIVDIGDSIFGPWHRLSP